MLMKQEVQKFRLFHRTPHRGLRRCALAAPDKVLPRHLYPDEWLNDALTRWQMLSGWIAIPATI
jgi:hypothetical protein